MKAPLSVSLLFVLFTGSCFGGNSQTDLNILATWLITYQPINPSALPDGTLVAASWMETVAMSGSNTIDVTPLSDPINAQSICVGTWNYLNDDYPYNPNLTGVGIANSCIVTRLGVPIGMRKILLRVEAFTSTSLKGFFRSDMFDLNGNLLATINGTVSGNSVIIAKFPWADIEQLPTPTP